MLVQTTRFIQIFLKLNLLLKYFVHFNTEINRRVELRIVIFLNKTLNALQEYKSEGFIKFPERINRKNIIKNLFVL